MDKKSRSCPEVSILTTTYNRPHLIGAAIDSILRQTFQNFELIIVDASDNAETRKVVMRHRDPRVIYIHRRCNIPRGRNIGFKHARGQYVTYCDDDERYDRTRLTQLKRFLDRNPDVGLVYADMLAVKNGKEFFRIEYDFERSHLESQGFFGVGNVMHKRECITAVGGFDERLTILEDWDLWLRISDCFRIVRLPKALNTYLIHGTNVTLRKENRFGEVYERIIRRILRKKNDEGDVLENYIKESSFCVSRNLFAFHRVGFATYFIEKYCVNSKTFQGLASSGLCELARKNFPKAIPLFLKSIQAVSANEDHCKPSPWQRRNIAFGHLYLSQAYFFKGDIALAVCEARKAGRVFALPETDLQLSKCYAKIGSYQKALNLLRGINGYPVEVTNLRAYCNYRLNKSVG